MHRETHVDHFTSSHIFIQAGGKYIEDELMLIELKNLAALQSTVS